MTLGGAGGGPAQPSEQWSIPTADSVKEDQLFNQSTDHQRTRHDPGCQSRTTIEQPAGRDWRQYHEVTLPWIGAIAIIGMAALLGDLLPGPRHGGMIRGGGAPGRSIVRFTAVERFIHWMTATCFIVLS